MRDTKKWLLTRNNIFSDDVVAFRWAKRNENEEEEEEGEEDGEEEVAVEVDDKVVEVQTEPEGVFMVMGWRSVGLGAKEGRGRRGGGGEDRS